MELNGTIEVLDNIPFELDAAKVMKLLRIHGDSRRFEEIVHELIGMAAPVARPKAVYKAGCVGRRSGSAVEIDGIEFTSHVLRINLDKAVIAFPFVATCGREIDSVDIPAGEVLKRYCMDVIKMTLAVSASAYVQDHIGKHFSTGKLTSMNPGELKTWPITQLKEVFSVLRNVEDMIGVNLTDSYTMVPLKSRAGIIFTTETNFESCQLCLQKRCPGRKVAYNPNLEKEYEEKARAPSD